MYEAIVFFLLASLVLYGLLGGADFGAGILEIFSPPSLVNEIEDTVYQAMGPVWEANHMWLVLAIVILFNGFPNAYAEISILLHIPLTLLLISIIVRGCAFTFRHYDIAGGGRSAKLYSLAFHSSSLFSALLIGMMTAALIKGQFLGATSGSYWQVYWQPWFSPFCLSVGIFVCILYAYQSVAFLIGEEISTHLRKFFRTRTKQLLLAAIVWGPVVFLISYMEEAGLERKFFSSTGSLASLLVASLIVPLVWISMDKNFKWLTRFALGIQISCILFGVIFFQYPGFIVYKNGAILSLRQAIAPTETQKALLNALAFGSVIIFPSLFYLFRIFKKKSSCMDTVRKEEKHA